MERCLPPGGCSFLFSHVSPPPHTPHPPHHLSFFMLLSFCLLKALLNDHQGLLLKLFEPRRPPPPPPHTHTHTHTPRPRHSFLCVYLVLIILTGPRVARVCFRRVTGGFSYGFRLLVPLRTHTHTQTTHTCTHTHTHTGMFNVVIMCPLMCKPKVYFKSI